MKIKWKALGGFLKRWAPVIVEAVLTAKARKKAKEQEEEDAAQVR